MSIDDQGEPRARQTAAGAPLDLMAVYDNLVPVIHAQCGNLAATPNPVIFAFIDTSEPQMTTSMRGVPTDVSQALWTQGLQALRDIADAALDPARQLDAVSQLGLQTGFCPDLAVLVFQFWSIHEMCDGLPQKRHSYDPRAGAPHRLQVEPQVHGGVPGIAEWKVLQRDWCACAVPPPSRNFVGPLGITAWEDAPGFVQLEVQNGLVVPTFYGADSNMRESFWPRGTEMVVYPGDGGRASRSS